jgi:hypothetical protein
MPGAVHVPLAHLTSRLPSFGRVSRSSRTARAARAARRPRACCVPRDRDVSNADGGFDDWFADRRRAMRRGRAADRAGSEPRLRRLVLVGAGRAHLHLLRALSRPIVRGLELVLVTTDRVQYDPR